MKTISRIKLFKSAKLAAKYYIPIGVFNIFSCFFLFKNISLGHGLAELFLFTITAYLGFTLAVYIFDKRMDCEDCE